MEMLCGNTTSLKEENEKSSWGTSI